MHYRGKNNKTNNKNIMHENILQIYLHKSVMREPLLLQVSNLIMIGILFMLINNENYIDNI